MVVTIIDSVTVGNIIFHATSVMGSESKVVVQAYASKPTKGNVYLTGSIASSEKEAMDAINAIRIGDESHWGFKMIEMASKEI
jgi:hypothetical protein